MSRKIFTGLLLLFAPGVNSIVTADDHLLRLNIVDADTGKPLAARVYLQSTGGESHYFSSDDPAGSAVRYEKQNWINKNSVEYHTTVSAHACTSHVPDGDYELIVERGKTYFPHHEILTIRGANKELTVSLRQWENPAAKNWYSGDTHLHRTIDELINIVVAEDLNVAVPLTNWVTLSDTPPSAGNKNLTDISDGLIEVDSTHVIWPRNTEYEIFSVGKTRHTLGALFVLGHRAGHAQGVPPWKPVVETVKLSDPNALFDMDKLDWPFAMVLPTVAPNALYELSNNHVWRTEFAFEQWNTRAPPHIQPPFGRNVGGHRRWIDYTLGMYYSLLNCGFRLPPSAGTANGVHPVPAGFGRVYVHLPNGFDYSSWMKGLKRGRSFVTTGPMMYATADGKSPGEIFQSDGSEDIKLDMHVLSEQKLSYGELLVNGRPEMLLRPQNLKTKTGAWESKLTANVRPHRSGWFAIRFWQPMRDGQSRFVHSAPWYVDVKGEKVKPFVHDKDYMVRRIEDEMKRSRGIVSDDAMQEYVRALNHYQSLETFDDQDSIQSNARPLQQAERKRWLDNMIIDHRFSADEIRAATGLDRAGAMVEIESRREQKPSDGFRILPYPGGRHPRIGFLDGAINPQRETKISVFPPWSTADGDGGYVVVDVPEAVFSNLGLTYLAHTHIPTIWDDQAVELERLEWKNDDQGLAVSRRLPNGIVMTSEVTNVDDAAMMKISLTNGTKEKLTGLRVQVCTMLKGAVGFNVQEKLVTVVDGPIIAIKAEDKDQWIITAWKPLHRTWANPPVPCFHSDPIFPDCSPGETVSVSGGLWFYEGDDVKSAIKELKLP